MKRGLSFARYASVGELASDIETVLDGRTPAADHAPLVAKLARFYVTRDPGMSRMRVVDVDLWMMACHFFVAGVALLVLRWMPLASWWWAFLVVGAAIMVRPTTNWWRLRSAPPS